jgi:hypothetical protein
MRQIVVLMVCAGSPALGLAQVYATAELGYASADFNLGAPYNGVIDDRALSLGVDVGFNITDHFALELGATKYNSFDGRATPCAPGQACTQLVQSTGSNDIVAYTFTLIPHVELGDVELFGEIGYYGMRIDTQIGLPDDDFKERGLYTGIGARWYFREPWSVSIEASRLDDNIYQLEVGAGWGLRLGDEPDGTPERTARR